MVYSVWSKKPERIKSGVKNEENKVLNVLSLFSGCGGMDLGFEGGFDVLAKSVNMHMHKDWKIKKSKDGWVRLPKINFIQYLLMILNQRQKRRGVIILEKRIRNFIILLG